MEEFDYRGQSIVFSLIQDCSVSAHIRRHRDFYEREFLEAMEQVMSAATEVVDVGAHIGNHTIFFAAVLGLHVHAFEPNPEAFEKLEANVDLNNVTHLVSCHNVALSSEEGLLAFAPTTPGDAGTMSVLGAASKVQDQNDDVIEARVFPLDHFAEELAGPQLFMKLDVEGHELSVLRGAKRTIDQFRPLVSTEIRDIESLDQIDEFLGPEYEAIGLFNASPTVLFSHASGGVRVSRQRMARYGVESALAYNQRRSWYVAERDRAARLEETLGAARQEVISFAADLSRSKETESRLSQEVESLSKVLAVEKTLVDGLLEGLQTSSDLDRLRTVVQGGSLAQSRILIITAGESSIPVDSLAAFVGTLDAVEVVGETTGLEVRFRAHLGDRNEIAGSHHFATRQPMLPSALVSLLMEEWAAGHRVPDVVVFENAERYTGLLEHLIDALQRPYVLIWNQAPDSGRHLRKNVVARGSFLTQESELQNWMSGQIMPARALDPTDLVSLSEVLADTVSPGPPLGHVGESSDLALRILIVSYYAPPSTTVSVQRLAYWASALPTLGAERGVSMGIDWLTATGSAQMRRGAMVVPDFGPWSLSGSEWDEHEELCELGLDTLGASWSHYVRTYFSHNDHSHYDAVIISGNPFYYFDLASYFKTIWGSSTILDFRDPFALNPRRSYSREQRSHLIALENRYVASSDAVISVNNECLETIAPNVQITKRVIANGFDESLVDTILSVRPSHDRDPARVNLVYSGTVFANLPLDDLLESIPPDRFRLTHFGRDLSANQATRVQSVVQSMGVVPYEQLIKQLGSADAGIIMTSGEASTQTTKVFDYIACDLEIIIVTEGTPKSGNLHELTEGLEGVHWVRNRPEELERFFKSYRPSGVHRIRRHEFSRLSQARELLDLIMEKTT